MKKIITSITLLFLFIGNITFSQSSNSSICPVIPTPSVYQTIQGSFIFSDKKIQINSTNLPSEIGLYLKSQLATLFSIQSTEVQSNGEIIFKTIQNVPKDSYSIDVSDKITITYSSEQSCFYAINSLLQLIHIEDSKLQITKSFINDSPKFQWRGMHLDVSRHFFTMNEVKRYIDLMALYKFNTFHWHLTDDQGWRIEIKKYPKLTEIGACRDSTLIGHYNDSPRKYEKKKTDGFYTQEQIKEIVAYASKKYITVVPEIEMPGHSRAALAAYPEFSCTGKQQPVPGLWGVFEDIYCSKPQTIEFLQNILEEVIPLFPSNYIHIGGDEAPKARWLECLNCHKVMADHQLKDVHELQSYFVKMMDNYLTSKGKKLIGWDEILEGGISPNATIMSWQGEKGGIEAIKQKHNVVMTPINECYFDHYQSNNPNEPLAIGGYLPIENVYNYNPIPKGLTNEEASYILGSQANVWTEYISSMSQLELMVFPRALAMSQVLWCREQKPSFESFKNTLIDYQFPFLYRYKVNYSIAILNPRKIE